MEVKTKFDIGDTVYYLATKKTDRGRPQEVVIAKDRVAGVRVNANPDIELETEKDLDVCDSCVSVSYILFNYTFYLDETELFSSPKELADHIANLTVTEL